MGGSSGSRTSAQGPEEQPHHPMHSGQSSPQAPDPNLDNMWLHACRAKTIFCSDVHPTLRITPFAAHVAPSLAHNPMLQACRKSCVHTYLLWNPAGSQDRNLAHNRGA